MMRVMAAAAVVLLTAGLARADELVGDTDRAFVATMNQQLLFVTRLAGTAGGQGAAAETRTQATAASARAAANYLLLKRLADKWQIGTPGTLLHPFWEEYDRTVGLSGAPFDAAYKAALAKADAAQAAAVADQIKSGENPELRDFASSLTKSSD